MFTNKCNTHKAIYHINKIKGKNHIVISADAEKTFDKISHPFLIKTLKKLRTEGTNLNIIKTVHEKPKDDIIANREKLKTCPLKPERDRTSTLTTPTQYRAINSGHSN